MSEISHPRYQISIEERAELTRLAESNERKQSLGLRAQIILLSELGHTQSQIADKLKVSRKTVSKWQSRFSKTGLKGLRDIDRPGAPRKYLDPEIRQLVTNTVRSYREKNERPSPRELARKTGLSRQTIAKILSDPGPVASHQPT